MEWPRTPEGTLQCPCGRAGKIFHCISITLQPQGTFGVFGGYCSEECYKRGAAHGHPVPERVQVAVAPPENMFEGLFA